ncbi:MAG TPA: RNA polymerase sigma factor [Caulobacteraceae bacterium]
MAEQFSAEMQSGTRAAWSRFVDLVEPFRPDLARYCRRLTGHIWDAEDLAQDTLLRSFSLLGSMGYAVGNPRAYLLRVATNIWIDAQRRRLLEAGILADVALSRPEARSRPSQEDQVQVRDAGAVLLQYLAPQERAAVLLKDVLDMSLDETASILATTSGAVRAALHRGRDRLKDVQPAIQRPVPDPAVVDQFVERYNARDLPGLVALMLDSASVEMSVVVNEFGREGYEREQGWFFHSVVGSPGEYERPLVRQARKEFRGEPLVIQLHTLWGAEVMTSIIRLETVDGKIARLRSYTFCPDAIGEVAEALGFTVGPVFYSFPPFLASWQSMPAAALR